MHIFFPEEIRMVTAARIEEFLSRKVIGVVGVSRAPRKFGYQVFKELLAKGYQAYPVNPHAAEVHGVACFPAIGALPADTAGVVIVVPPENAENLAREAHARGIDQVWFQPGAESREAVAYCEANGMNVIAGECILVELQTAGDKKLNS